LLDDLQAKNLTKKLQAVLNTLTDREQMVLRLRFGLGGYCMTLREVGRVLEVTPERIRQIEAKGIRKMRHPTRIKMMEDALNAPSSNAEVSGGRPRPFAAPAGSTSGGK